ncbi:ricin-type beta-trefoil lectin domain protein [Sedimenticola sp.]|uniref:ricin-type beta-trefoil lectin domain protein n=1 Tax=Sedimenticola sp. TaxID=1940285 RepID=UPI003D142F87
MNTRLVLLIVMTIAPLTSHAVDKARPGLSYTFSMNPKENIHLCMDIAGGKAKPGDRVQTYNCKENIKSNLNQRWLVTGLNELIGHGGICLDAYDQGGGVGSQLKMQPCNGSAFQKWAFHYPGGEVVDQWPNVMIKSTKGYCIGVANGTPKNKTPLQLVDCKRKTLATWQQRRSQSAQAAICAKRVRELNKRYLTELGGANDYDAEKICDSKENDVYQAFDTYLSLTLDRFRRNTREKAKRTLNR